MCAIAFNCACFRLDSLQSIPEPSGGTALHYAIAQGIPHNPRATLVICDGRPDDPKQALSLAKKLSGVINTLYIGSDRDSDAIAFMRQLARLGCGKSVNCDVSNPQNQSLLSGKVQNLLESKS